MNPRACAGGHIAADAITLGRYRVFAQPERFEIRPLTILIGPNNAGKSALPRLPILLSRAFAADARGALELDEGGLDFGGSLLDLLHGARCTIGPSSGRRSSIADWTAPTRAARWGSSSGSLGIPSRGGIHDASRRPSTATSSTRGTSRTLSKRRARVYRAPAVRRHAGLSDAWPPPGRGLPIGTAVSQYLAVHVYLNGLDHHIKRAMKVPAALRYGDNILLFGRRRAELRAWRAEVGRWLWHARGLRLKHPEARVLSCAGHIDALGYRITRTGRRPSGGPAGGWSPGCGGDGVSRSPRAIGARWRPRPGCCCSDRIWPA